MKYIANLYQNELMTVTMRGEKFLNLLSDLVDRLDRSKKLTHGFIRCSHTGEVKIICRKTKKGSN